MRCFKSKKILCDGNDIIGFLISSNCDTILDLYLNDISYNWRKNNLISEYGDLEILPEISVPYIVFKSKDVKLSKDEILKDNLPIIKKRLLNSQYDSKNTDSLQKDILHFDKTVFGSDILCTTEDMFYCYSIYQDIVLFVGNPFMVIAKENQLIQRKSYKQFCGMKLTNQKGIQKEYLIHLDKYQMELNKKLKEMFQLFVSQVNANSIVVGDWFFGSDIGYAILSGTKEDSEYCTVHNFVPCIVVDNSVQEDSDTNISKIYKIKNFLKNLKQKIFINKK